jgi:hypothetical protein
MGQVHIAHIQITRQKFKYITTMNRICCAKSCKITYVEIIRYERKQIAVSPTFLPQQSKILPTFTILKRADKSSKFAIVPAVGRRLHSSTKLDRTFKEGIKSLTYIVNEHSGFSEIFLLPFTHLFYLRTLHLSFSLLNNS